VKGLSLALVLLLLIATAWLRSPLAAPLRVTDDAGRSVELERPAQRIVTLAPHATELVVALGLQSHLVAVADFFDYPDSLQGVPRLNSLGSIDRERLLLFQPDLVVAWGSGNRSGDLHWLRKAGIPLFVSEPQSLEAIARTLEKLALLAGVAERGKAAAEAFRNRLERACRQRRKAPPQPTYYEIWPRPPMTIGGSHWLNQVLAKAALRNIFAEIPRQVITVSRESLLARPHEIIIVSHPLGNPSSRKPKVVVADATLGRPGPRVLEGLEKLCRSL
jgi:iron complex transport system substrate-binding protein